jgi:hypothetical protein
MTNKQPAYNMENEKYSMALKGYMVDLVERFGNIPLSPDNARIPLRTDLSSTLHVAPSLSPHITVRQSRWSNSSPATILDSAVASSEADGEDLGKYDHSQSSHTFTTVSMSAHSSIECSPRTPRRTTSLEEPSTNAASRWVGRCCDTASPSPPLRPDRIWGELSTKGPVRAAESPGRGKPGRRRSSGSLVWVEGEGGKRTSPSLSSSSRDSMKQSRPPRLPDILRRAPY